MHDYRTSTIGICETCKTPFAKREPQSKYCSRDCFYVGFRANFVKPERFWVRVNRAGTDDCWEWQRSRNSCGYGTYRSSQAHRYAWELTHGPIPEGLHVLHRCDNPPCCNPSHLFLGTAADNNADKETKGRGNHVRGEQVGREKLTESAVQSIRARAMQGESLAHIAPDFGVTKVTIRHVVRRRTWKHVA